MIKSCEEVIMQLVLCYNLSISLHIVSWLLWEMDLPVVEPITNPLFRFPFLPFHVLISLSSETSSSLPS